MNSELGAENDFLKILHILIHIPKDRYMEDFFSNIQFIIYLGKPQKSIFLGARPLRRGGGGME